MSEFRHTTQENKTMNALLKIPKFDGIPVEVTPDAITKRDEILTLSSAVVKVDDGKELQVSVNSSKALKEFVKECENFCDLEKAPFYTTYKKIMAMIEELKLPALDEIARLKRLNDGFATREANRVAEENRRIAEEQRKKEEAAAAAIAEQDRIAREAAEKTRLENERIENERIEKQKNMDAALEESKRLEGLKRQSPEKTAAAQKEIAKAQAELEKTNAQKPQPATNIAQEIAAEEKVITTQNELQRAQTVAPARMTRAAGMRIRTLVKFEITDRIALQRARPEFFDLVEKKSVINAAITKDTVLPGLRVWEAVET